MDDIPIGLLYLSARRVLPAEASHGVWERSAGIVMVYHRKPPSHVVTPGSYERIEKDDRVYYYPEMAACAHCGEAFKIHLDVADSDFLVLVVNYHRKPGHDAAEYWHHIPWEQVDDLVIGNHD